MEIGILSDTHNHETNLIRALKLFNERGIKQLYHCSDLTDPGMVKYFGNFHVTYVFGNVDNSREMITAAWKELNDNNWSGELFNGEIEGTRIAMTHGHVVSKVTSLAMSKKLKYIFHGHTHRRRDEMIGETRVINPGVVAKALDGYSVCTLDISSGNVQFLKIG